jgi:hypothetical protein
MSSRPAPDRFGSCVLAGLAIVATIAITSLTCAVANIQIVA